jgi:hypothetical protein
MDFTPEQKNAVIAKLNTFLKKNCPFCDTTSSYRLQSGIFNFTSRFQGQEWNSPSVGLVCVTCGYTHYHNLYVLELADFMGVAPAEGSQNG